MKILTYDHVDKLLTKKGFKLIKVVENDFEDTDYLETNYIYQKGTVKLDINTCDNEVVFIMISDKHNHHQSLRLDKFDEYIRYNLLDSFEESKKSARKSFKESYEIPPNKNANWYTARFTDITIFKNENKVVLENYYTDEEYVIEDKKFADKISFYLYRDEKNGIFHWYEMGNKVEKWMNNRKFSKIYDNLENRK